MAAEEKQWTDEKIERAMYEEEPEELESEASGDTAQDTDDDSQGRQDRFRFSDEQDDSGQDQGDTGQGDAEYVEIVHRGQVHRVTPEKAKELAQKGFDYDVKVGPHARIAQLIQTDPELAQMVDNHVRAKMGQGQQGQQPQQTGQGGQGQGPAKDPVQELEIEPADKFDTDEEWLQANMQKAVQATVQQMQQAQAQNQAQAQPQPQQGVSSAEQLLLSHDPHGFRQVAPRLKEFAAKHLTVEQYQRVNNDPTALVEFYDWVKPQVLGQSEQQGQGGQRRQKPAASFRAQSGGGTPSRGKGESDKIWDMPNDQFEKELAKIKGF